MHICIVGTGTSGWLVANQIKELDEVTKVTIIGSPRIPHIGVGESTTLLLPRSHEKFDLDVAKFVKESAAAVKYGVYYEGWSPHSFIHYFKSNDPYVDSNSSARRYLNTLANKDEDTHIHDLMGRYLWEDIHRNLVYYGDEELEHYPRTWHFDAGLYIQHLEGVCTKSKKVDYIKDTVTDVLFYDKDNQYIQELRTEDGRQIKADYYVNTSGQRNGENVFQEQYEDISHWLLTNKAVVYPLPYTDKREQFHPYTKARAMKHGWRWITPTYERIGTGYVFSDNHISVDEAVQEFKDDIGDQSIEPNVVDFTPKLSKQTFKANHCSIGMANGFLEPLDAPGLATTNGITNRLEELLKYHSELITDNTYEDFTHHNEYIQNLNLANESTRKTYDFWIIFILNQYKTSRRQDTSFWIDHKNVKHEYWDLAMTDLNSFCDVQQNDFDVMMLAQTTAAKGYQWSSPDSQKPFVLPEKKPMKVQHHLDFVKGFHNL